MGKCLVTKLKQSVQNPYLLGINEYGFVLKAGDVIDGLKLNRAADTTVSLEQRVGDATISGYTGNSFPYDITNSTNYSRVEVTITGGSIDSFLVITNKYLIIDPSAAVIGMELKEIVKNFPNTDRLVYPYHIKGEIKDLCDFEHLVLLRYNESDDYKITGDIADLAPLAGQLTEIRLYDADEVDGSLEEFVSRARSNGMTTGTLKFSGFRYSNITFYGEGISDGTSMGKNLTWTADSITFE
jgi:hypothetical protein